jgi:hypothetical protein
MYFNISLEVDRLSLPNQEGMMSKLSYYGGQPRTYFDNRSMDFQHRTVIQQEKELSETDLSLNLNELDRRRTQPPHQGRRWIQEKTATPFQPYPNSA